MTVKASYSSPMLHAGELERSIEFYERRSFTFVRHQPGKTISLGPVWRQSPADPQPACMPSGEVQFADPGYGILISHWEKVEQEAWEKRISEKA